MITIRTSYLIVSIRILIYITTFLSTKLVADFFDSNVDVELFISIGILVTFFSLLTIFLYRLFEPLYIFYSQAFFDILITIFLISNTGYLDSPYIIFFSVIMIYMGFYEGFKGGIVGLLLVVISLSFLAIFKSEIFIVRYYNFKYLILGIEYIFSFLLIVFLVSLLNKRYKSQIEESKQFRTKLDELTNLHRLILESIDFGIILIDNTGNVISLNDSAKSILNIGDDLVGKKLVEKISFDDLEGIIDYNGKHIGYKIKDFRNQNGYVSGKLIIFQDVSEREELKIKLEEEKRLADIGRFSSVIAHEIKNPLGAIKGAFQILSKNIHGNDKIIKIVDREMSRLELFLGNMLIVAKDSTGIVEDIFIKDIIDDFVYYINMTNIFDGMVINNHVDTDITIRISEGEFKQILWNLFLNSYEVKNDTKIRIYNHGNKLFYEDDGPGINEEQIPFIGKPFFTTKSSGTGLGFYTISKICEKRGITYKIYSNKLNKGFKVEFNFFI
ncbi:MAG: PAS domain-containing protein [Calditerrivibrio sp.]|nr:PAS domain-containing protein [Calditerrivibrio sp.]